LSRVDGDPNNEDHIVYENTTAPLPSEGATWEGSVWWRVGGEESKEDPESRFKKEEKTSKVERKPDENVGAS